MFQTKAIEKIKTHNFVQEFYPKIVPFMRCGKIWYSRAGHGRQYDMVHAIACWIDKAADNDSEYVILAAFTATTVTRTFLFVYVTLPVSLP
jgi:hypothetical protein